MSELRDECGVAAIYHLPGKGVSPLCLELGPEGVSRLMPRMLLDIQNRGQLAAGMTSFNPHRSQLIDTHKEVGSVSEVFRMSHRAEFESLMKEYTGRAAIGHVRYATCGAEDRSYAQPFERHHIKKHKWFSFAFNGQLANYVELRSRLLDDDDNHLARETDTEIFMHEICTAVSVEHRPPLVEVFRQVAEKFDGAYSVVFLDALGDMVVARDPLGIKPLCYAVEGPLFAAASESVALMNLGFAPQSIKSLPPGQAVVISDGRLEIADVRPQPAPCPLLLRMGLLRQRGQHAGRAERLSRPQGAGRGVGPVRDGAHRRGHRGRAGSRHQQGGGRRHGLCPEDPQRRGPDPQPLQRPDLYRGQRRPQTQGRNQVHPAPRSARRKAGAAGRGLDRPGDHAEGPLAADARVGTAQGNPRPRGLSADHLRPASTASTCRRSASFSPRSFFRAGRSRPASRPRWRPGWGPIRSAICPSKPSPGRSVSRPASCVKPASRANIPRPAVRSWPASPSRTTATTSPAGPTKPSAPPGNCSSSRHADAAPAGSSFIALNFSIQSSRRTNGPSCCCCVAGSTVFNWLCVAWIFCV